MMNGWIYGNIYFVCDEFECFANFLDFFITYAIFTFIEFVLLIFSSTNMCVHLCNSDIKVAKVPSAVFYFSLGTDWFLTVYDLLCDKILDWELVSERSLRLQHGLLKIVMQLWSFQVFQEN